jgi:hypothetical protein
MALIFWCAVAALIGILYLKAERAQAMYDRSVDYYDEDPYAELYWGSGNYRLSVDCTRIVDVLTGKSFPATSDEVEQLKKETRRGKLTCDTCLSPRCPFRGDEYNTNGYCLMSK